MLAWSSTRTSSVPQQWPDGWLSGSRSACLSVGRWVGQSIGRSVGRSVGRLIRRGCQHVYEGTLHVAYGSMASAHHVAALPAASVVAVASLEGRIRTQPRPVVVGRCWCRSILS